MSDNDQLEQLRKAMHAATPRPDPDAKARHLRLAEENFAAFQGTRQNARHTPERPERGAWFKKGVLTMLHALSSRGALVATTSAIVAAVGLFTLWPGGGPAPLPGVLQKPLPGPAADAGKAAETARESLAPAVTEDMPRSASVTKPSTDSAAAAPPPGPSAAPTRKMIPAATGVAPFPPEAPALQPGGNTETFANGDPHPVRIAAEEPVSTFSIDVDTASWAIVRSSLMRGKLPPPEAVRIEEMINYFPYDYPVPTAAELPFRPTVTVLQSPWNEGTQLVHLAIQGRKPALEKRPPLNLVFLIDTSGSMQGAGRLPLLKQSFRLMLSQLRPEDRVAIVTYAGSAGTVLPPTPAGARSSILAALDHLGAGGSTAGQAGLQQAYAVAEEMAGNGNVTRVLLATDGDFNIGISDPAQLKDYIAGKRRNGIYLSVLGFGRGNLDDATMQALAQNGNGTAAYIDTLAEARKVLVDQLAGTVFPIADDVKIQVEFNPAQVAEYRLIGYETRALAREDFNNDAVDAGEIGAGTSVTAIYEITPVGSPAILNDPLRYESRTSTTASESAELAFLRIRWKAPGGNESRLIETPILPGAGEANEDVRFSVAIAGFGQILKGGKYLHGWSYPQAVALANGARGDDPFGYRAEAVRLMRIAESLARQ